MKGEVVVIANPAAGRGRGARVLTRMKPAFARLDPRYVTTRVAGEEEHLAAEAAARGAETIVVVGGDGTWGNAAHGVLLAGASPRFALLAGGTGNDFARGVGAPAQDLARTAELIESGAVRDVDVGRAGEQTFLNCCGFGFDTAVLARLSRIAGLRGAPRYLVAALVELARYPGFSVKTTPGPARAPRESLLLAFANAPWYGGLFRIAPQARMDDGLLDVVHIAHVSRIRRLLLLAAALRGKHIGRAGVESYTGAAFTLEFPAPPMVNTDGESRRSPGATVKISLTPRALRVVAPAPLP